MLWKCQSDIVMHLHCTHSELSWERERDPIVNGFASFALSSLVLSLSRYRNPNSCIHIHQLTIARPHRFGRNNIPQHCISFASYTSIYLLIRACIWLNSRWNRTSSATAIRTKKNRVQTSLKACMYRTTISVGSENCTMQKTLCVWQKLKDNPIEILSVLPFSLALSIPRYLPLTHEIRSAVCLDQKRSITKMPNIAHAIIHTNVSIFCYILIGLHINLILKWGQNWPMLRNETLTLLELVLNIWV